MPKFTGETVRSIFGAEDAENEVTDRLKQYFFRNKAYELVCERVPVVILVGHKGVGKSALLKMAHLEDTASGRLSVWIQPNDLADILASSDEIFIKRIENWKQGIITAIYKKILEKFGFSKTELSSVLFKNSAFGLIESVKNLFSKNGSNLVTKTAQTIAASFYTNQEIFVYIDDLDRGWRAKESDIDNLSALLNAVRDICTPESKLRIRIGLRTDVYHLVRTSDESTDKIESHIVPLVWTNHEILVLMAKRIAAYFDINLDDSKLLKQTQVVIAKHFEQIIVKRFSGSGKWENAPIHRVLLSLTRRRPRDLVKLFHASAKEAYRNGNQIIQTSDLRAIFESYSNERLQDIVNEFKSELPQIEALVLGMRPTRKHRTAVESFLFANDALHKKIQNIMSQNRFVFTNNKIVTSQSLAEFLFKTDFIVARRTENGIIQRYFFDQNKNLLNKYADYGFSWEIHAAYRWALQPGSLDKVFADIE